MGRIATTSTLINFYAEETKPGQFRYQAMCPLRLAVILDPAKIRGEEDKPLAASLIIRACAWHLERAQGEERMKAIIDVMKKMKRYEARRMD